MYGEKTQKLRIKQVLKKQAQKIMQKLIHPLLQSSYLLELRRLLLIQVTGAVIMARLVI